MVKIPASQESQKQKQYCLKGGGKKDYVEDRLDQKGGKILKRIITRASIKEQSIKGRGKGYL